MGSSLPTEAHATCAGILVYSFACLFASLIVLWLVWVHNERKSYVALLAFFTSLSTLASIIQQIHTIIDWEGIKTEQHRYLSNNIGNPEIAIAGSSYGLDLVLFYIQFYSYNVESMLTMFWAAELAYSVFRVEANTPTFMGVRIKPGLVAKGAAILLPIIQVSLLRSRAVQRNTPAFLVLANMTMIFSLASGSLLLLVILVKYIYSRRALISWNVRYGRESRRTGASQLRSQDSSLAQVPHRSIYDRWLVVRFTIAFASLGAFQLVTILFEMGSMASNDPGHISPQPDLSAARATLDFVLFMPGVTASLLVFVVFGTTRTFRDYAWRRLVPGLVRRKVEARNMKKRMPSVVIRASQVAMPATNTENWPPQSSPTVSRHAYTIGHAGPGNITPTSDGFSDIGLQDMGKAGKPRQEEDERPILTRQKIMPR